MYAEVLNNIATATAFSYILAATAVFATKYVLKMLQIDLHLI